MGQNPPWVQPATPKPLCRWFPRLRSASPPCLSLRREGRWPEKCSSRGPPPPAGPPPPPIGPTAPHRPTASHTNGLAQGARGLSCLAGVHSRLASQPGAVGSQRSPEGCADGRFSALPPTRSPSRIPTLPGSRLSLSVSVYVHGILGWFRRLRIRLQCRRPWLDSWVHKIRWRRDRLPTPVFLGFPCGPDG